MENQTDYPAEMLGITEGNRKACRRFDDARAALADENFELALRYLEGYRRLVDYREFYRLDLRVQGRAQETLRASVAVVAYHTGGELIACLESLLGDALPEKEIIVIDNGGNGAVLPALLQLPLLYVKTPQNLFPSEARNIAAALGRSPLLILIDDDAIAEPDCCRNACAAFDDPKVLAVGGRAIPKLAAGDNTALAHADAGASPHPARVTLECACAWRRQEYLQAGGMDPLLFGHEGEELSLRLLDRHPEAKLLYWPSMVVRHDLADSGSDHAAKSERHRLMSRYFRWKRRRDLRPMG